METLKPRTKLTIEEWVEKNRSYDGTTGRPGPRDVGVTPYIRAIHAFFDNVTGVQSRYSKFSSYETCVFVCGTQMSKALALETPIATVDGWKTIGDIEVGDVVFGDNGLRTKVVATSQVFTDKECFEVQFCDGSSIIASGDHRWAVEKFERSHRASTPSRRDKMVLTTNEILAAGLQSHSGASVFSVKNASPAEGVEQCLPIPPYILGVWLGDGNSRAPAITVGKQDLEETSALIRAEGFITTPRPDKNCFRVHVAAIDSAGMPVLKHGPMNLRTKLRSLGLIANKHIPMMYLRSTEQDRMALLQGLMDTDGTVDKNGAIWLVSAKFALAQQYDELVASLGFRPVLSHRVDRLGNESWAVRFCAYSDRPVFRLERKRRRQNDKGQTGRRSHENDRRYIRAIKSVGVVPCKCIAVDNESHLFLAGKKFIPTHNTETVLDAMGWRLAVRPRPQLYVGPDQNFARDIFEPRLQGMIDQSPSLKENKLRRKKVLKYVNGVRTRMAWGGSASSMASDQAGDVNIDEYDKMFQAQRKQGDPYNLAKARTDTYADRKIFVTSTPLLGRVETYKDPRSGLIFWKPTDGEDEKDIAEKVPSNIWRRWMTGTMHHLAWPCPHCEDYFIPRFDLLSWPKNASAGVAKRETYMNCPCCGVDIEEHHKLKMLAACLFVAPGEKILPDGSIDGVPDVDTDTLSLWASGLASPFIDWGERAADYVTAKQTGNKESLQGARNNCGEVFSEIEVRQVTEDGVRKKCADYEPGQVPRQVLLVTMGVDVQGNRLVCVVRGWGARTRSYLLQQFEIFGRTSEEKVWQDLAATFDRTYGGLRIAKVCIDAGFRPDKKEAGDYHRVLHFCRRHDWICHPTRGKHMQAQPVIKRFEEVTAAGKADKFGLEVISVDTGYFKGRWYSQLSAPMNEAMSAHFPSKVPDDYAKQVVSEVRGEDGKWVPIYRQNHYLDAEVLSAVGAFMLKVQDIPDGSFRDNDSFEIIHPERVMVPVQTKTFAERMAERSARLNQ